MKTNVLKSLAPSSGLLCFILGSMVILGWYTNNQSLVQVHPSFAPMQFNTALGFLGCGLGLILFYIEKNLLQRLVGLAVFGLGLSTLLQYFLNLDFGIDNFFIEPVFHTKTSHPGRMAPNTALCFCLYGLALLIGTRKKSLMIGLSIAVTALSILSLCGYLIQYETLYGWGNLTRMAIHTAISFIILGTGILSFGFSKIEKSTFDFWQLIPTATFIMVVVMTLFSSYAIKEEATARNEAYFESLVEKTQDAIMNRYVLYEESLRGGLGLFYASQSVERQEWKNYVKALDIHEMLPGINGLGYIDYVLQEDLEQYLQITRQDGVSSFRNHPDTSYSDKFIIKYIEPIDQNSEALGLDIGFEANRRSAAEWSRDNAKPRLTKKIQLVQDQKKEPGFLLLIPVYQTSQYPGSVKQRRELIQGWVYAPFIATNFLTDINKINENQLKFKIYDGETTEKQSLIFQNFYSETEKEPDLSLNLKKETKLTLANRTWKILWYPNSKYSSPAHEGLGTFVLIFGLIFACLLYFTLKRLLLSKQIISEQVDIRTKELLETEQSLRQANEELEEFAYRTSHDLRSPIVSSISLLNMATESLEKKEIDVAIKSIKHSQTSLKKLETLVKDILALTRTKNAPENNQKVNLEEIVNDSLQKFSNMENFERLDILKNLEYSEDLILQKDRLVLIVENLISNAIKYQDTSKDKSFIKIKTYSKGKKFIFEVEDNGLGIPKEQQDKLFMMFKRFHGKTAFGSGLGLYMIKKSAHVLGGDVYYQNIENNTVFYLELPQK